jgi:hypothetical protein
MERNLCNFIDNTTIINKDLSLYADEKGNRFIFNTINAIVKVDYLELTKDEYQIAKFQQKIDDLDYNIINIKKRVPKNEITGKDEDKYTITEKEVAVRQVWNVSNPYGAYKSFTNKEEATELANKINNSIIEYFK